MTYSEILENAVIAFAAFGILAFLQTTPQAVAYMYGTITPENTKT